MDSLSPVVRRDIAVASAVATETRDGGSRPWITMVMISSIDGAVEIDGRSGGLGGPADLEMFRAMRGIADVILVGGGTARSENYGPIRIRPDSGALRVERGQSERPALAIVSGSLSFDPTARLFEDENFVPLILTTTAAAERAPAWLHDRADLLVAGDERVEPTAIVDHLDRLGFGTVILEGGPTLNGDFAAADLIDEMQLSISPLMVGGGGGRIVGGQAPQVPLRFRPRRIFTGDGLLFVSYVRTR